MSKSRKFLKKLRSTYRITLMNESTFRPAFSIKLTPLNILMLFSALLLVFTVIIFSLIAYTPVKNVIPGYSQHSEHNWVELNQKLEDTKRKLEAKQLKEDNLRKIFEEDFSGWDSASTPKPKKDTTKNIIH